MAYTKSAMRGVPVILQDTKTTGNGLVLAIPSSFREHIIYIKGNGAVGAGAIQLESSDAFDYSGTWAKLTASPTTVVATTEITINFSGTFAFIRARISTDITVGTVTVTYEGS